MDTLLSMQTWHDIAAVRAREAEIVVKRYEPVYPET